MAAEALHSAAASMKHHAATMEDLETHWDIEDLPSRGSGVAAGRTPPIDGALSRHTALELR
jgi:hypothetical protein